MRQHIIACFLVAIFCGCGPAADDTAAVPPPCADGSWGFVGDPDHAVHVSATAGTSAGDGTATDPVADVATALALVESDASLTALALWPGSHVASIRLGLASDGSSPYQDLAIAGCGPAESSLTAADDAEPVLTLTEVSGVHLEGLAIEGGTLALHLRGAPDVTIDEVTVRGSRMAGVVIDGPYTVVQASGLVVEQTQAEILKTSGTSLGIGIVVDQGSLTLDGGSIAGSTYVGLLVNAAAQLSLTGLTVSDTSASEGAFGRGIQIQGVDDVSLDTVTVSGCQDAGIFALLPLDFQASDCLVEDIASAAGDGASGDGIVITGDDGVGEYAASNFAVTLDDNTVARWESGSDRAGFYLENVWAGLAGNDPVDTQEILADERAVLSGSDTKSLDIVTGDLSIARSIDLADDLVAEARARGE